MRGLKYLSVCLPGPADPDPELKRVPTAAVDAYRVIIGVVVAYRPVIPR
jgi:hypothetical protein